jgi:hypothetical protein
VLAERAFIAPSLTVYADPTAKLNGANPAAPWVDLGIVKDSKITLVYTKDVKPVETGIEKVLRGTYVLGKKATASFTLEQYDIGSLALVGGLTATAVGVIGNKMQIGQDDNVENALLFLGTNKVDGKEFHHTTRKASMSWSIAEDGDARVLKVDAMLYSFLAAGETVEGFFTMIVLD